MSAEWQLLRTELKQAHVRASTATLRMQKYVWMSPFQSCQNACWPQIPKRWAYIARGESGDLSKVGVHDLTFMHAPGHCSGHVVYHHKPSGYLLAGDFTDVIQQEDGSYEIKTMCNSHTCNITQAHETICR